MKGKWEEGNKLWSGREDDTNTICVDFKCVRKPTNSRLSLNTMPTNTFVERKDCAVLKC